MGVDWVGGGVLKVYSVIECLTQTGKLCRVRSCCSFAEAEIETGQTVLKISCFNEPKPTESVNNDGSAGPLSQYDRCGLILRKHKLGIGSAINSNSSFPERVVVVCICAYYHIYVRRNIFWNKKMNFILYLYMYNI